MLVLVGEGGNVEDEVVEVEGDDNLCFLQILSHTNTNGLNNK